MLHVILYRPEIPQNTGSIGRLCAITCSRLHLIHPLGFKITDRHLKRSGMDYWKSLDVIEHKDWDSFLSSPERPQRIWLFTTHAKKSFWDVEYLDGDGLLFGNESSGCSEDLHKLFEDNRVTLPHRNEDMRSINLATTAGIAVYEALRQLR